MIKIIDLSSREILSSQQACEEWGIDSSTLRKRVHDFPVGTIRKFGTTYAVTRAGMCAVFGSSNENQAERRGRLSAMNQQVNIQTAQIKDDEWKQVIHQPLSERTPYETGGSLTITRVAGRILGTPHDETDYYIYLHELYESGDVHILSETLDKTIDQERFQAVQHIHMINQKEKGLSVNRFAAFLDGEQLIVKHSHPGMHRHLRQAFIEVLKTFQSFHEQGFNHPDFRRVLLDLVKWMGNHLEPWLKTADIEKAMPRVIWYGDATKSQIYFLYYLMLIGCDVLIFHPEGKDQFQVIDPDQTCSFVYTYPGTSALVPFPTEKPQRKSTVAYRSTKELDSVLHNEDSLMFKPWQFRSTQFGLRYAEDHV